MNQAFATYTLQTSAVIVDLDATNGAFRSFRLDRGQLEAKESLYSRAYDEADRWANAHGARLESFRPKSGVQ